MEVHTNVILLPLIRYTSRYSIILLNITISDISYNKTYVLFTGILTPSI